MICSSVNLDRFIRPSLRWAGLSLTVEEFQGVTSLGRTLFNRGGVSGGHVNLDDSLQDRGVSAFVGKNRLKGALSGFISEIEKGAVSKGSYLLIDSFDRLSREAVPVAVNLFTKILLENLIIVTLSDRRLYDRNADVMSIMYAVMQASRSHEESAEKGRKVRCAHEAAKRRAREEGYIWHRLGPTWLKYQRGRWKVISARHASIKRIFRDLDAGVRPGVLAASLNNDGVEPVRNAQRWTSASVIRLGRNRALIGEYQPYSCEGGRRRRRDGTAIPGYYPSLIENDLFDRVQARLTLRKCRIDAIGGVKHRRFNNLFRDAAVARIAAAR